MIHRSQFAILVEQSRMRASVVRRHRAICRWAAEEWQRRLQSIVPGDEGNVVERIDNRAFELRHHFHIVDILDVVTLNNGDASIDDHVLGMKGPEHWSMEIHDFEVKVGKLFWGWNSDLAIGIRVFCRFHRQVVVYKLLSRVSTTSYRRRHQSLSLLVSDFLGRR